MVFRLTTGSSKQVMDHVDIAAPGMCVFFVGAGGDGGNRSVIHNTLIARSCLQGDYETFQMKENVFNAASRARYPSLHTDVDQIGSNMKSCLNVPPYSVHHHIM